MLTLCFWLYDFLFFLSLSPAGCPDSLIKEVHHFRVLGDEQVGLDSEIRRSHLHTFTHTPSKQPSMSWSRLMRNPSSSWLSDRHMREAFNWPICCSPWHSLRFPLATKPHLRTITPAILAVRNGFLSTCFYILPTIFTRFLSLNFSHQLELLCDTFAKHH